MGGGELLHKSFHNCNNNCNDDDDQVVDQDHDDDDDDDDDDHLVEEQGVEEAEAVRLGHHLHRAATNPENHIHYLDAAAADYDDDYDYVDSHHLHRAKKSLENATDLS